MKSFYLIVIAAICICSLTTFSQQIPKGKLFIIGGGDRTPLMKPLLKVSSLGSRDYVVVLPMSSESPDTAFYYFKTDLESYCPNPILNFNLTPDKLNRQTWLDSLQHAKLIFITGGDQDRFMKSVANTPVVMAIHRAYKNGATIAGTSAGAAVMSKHMITGNQLTDTAYTSTFRKIVTNNIEFKEGLGLLDHAIIDQHFIARSRYNRLLSAIAKYPTYDCIGIDESTAIVVQGNKVRVVGQSQVIVISKPQKLKITSTGLIKMSDVQFRLYTDGDEFVISNQR